MGMDIDKKEQLNILNKFVNKFINGVYSEIDRINVVLIDNRYLEYQIFLNVGKDDIYDVIGDGMIEFKDDSDKYIDTSYLIQVMIISNFKSFLPQLSLPINKNHDVVVFDNEGNEIFRELDQLKKIYHKNPTSMGGGMYRDLMNIPTNEYLKNIRDNK
jgi:hypothetical protein